MQLDLAGLVGGVGELLDDAGLVLGEITLAQRRPWETTAEPDANTFKFKLKVS